MVYTKQSWTDGPGGGTPLSAARLNHIEAGIEAASAPAWTGEMIDWASLGADDEARATAMNAANAALGAGDPHPAYVLPHGRTELVTTPIVLYSGMIMVSPTGAPAREYANTCELKWSGASGTSLFTFPGSQTGQGYPSDGSPRSMYFEGIQFVGGSQRHFMPYNDPIGGDTTGKVLWMTQFHNCGWESWLSILWGFADGLSITGPFHVQGCYGTPFRLAGSENYLWTKGSIGFMDTSSAAYPLVANGEPFLRSRMEKSEIGTCMITCRDAGFGIVIEAGGGLTIDGLCIDAQDSDPFYGSAIKIRGGESIIIKNVSFKGGMTAPSSATGGAVDNRGWIDIDGAGVRGVVIEGCRWERAGNSPPATSVPLVYVDASVDAGEVVVHPQAVRAWGGAKYVVAEESAGQISPVGCDQMDLSTLSGGTWYDNPSSRQRVLTDAEYTALAYKHPNVTYMTTG